VGNREVGTPVHIGDILLLGGSCVSGGDVACCTKQ
jgi:hypothetical protein